MDQNLKLYNLVKAICKFLLKMFFPYEVENLENLEFNSSGYILCSNHVSNLDAIFLMVIHPEPICFLGKSSLFKGKLLSFFFTSMGVVSINRKTHKNEKSMKKSENILNAGKVLGIFIEGTRSDAGKFLRPHLGTALLAQNTKKPILPVCITGFKKNNRIKIFKKTKICYGKMLENLNFTNLKNSSKVIMDNIKSLRS
ncbi:MAG: 1-acyl-sn-glycerol-3-phosphate acyltransferase [Candidatus Paraimprobicoccus trichonymphae]|uniref:1-acyl-sn-glycerol-3-phosphate acyltransferase n=1 Tax=Candidatus Paraimprobicoccus trichonymphae TaxID=3033793 RepID=A0AA48I2K5_9FIRM|nr:MAG: 1-acyl-sn-glycerol-3-phosphate acyltransferase [Candidatus Paraimprobicoccus trichonymphae]